MELSTGFGWIEIDGRRYEKDILVHADGTISKRKKKVSKPLREEYGHTPLSEGKVKPLLKEDPEVIVVGTGQYGDLPLTPVAKKLLEKRGAIMRTTPKVLPIINGNLNKGRRMVAIVYLTC
jgi:hypothetical protein